MVRPNPDERMGRLAAFVLMGNSEYKPVEII